MNQSEQFDVVVIGGGASGMMAAISAAELGKSVVILEKNVSLGQKLDITGGGRCNITNAEFDVRKFLKVLVIASVSSGLCHYERSVEDQRGFPNRLAIR